MKWVSVQPFTDLGWIIASAGLVALLLLVGFLRIADRHFKLRGYRRARRSRRSAKPVPLRPAPRSMADPQAQIDAVSQANFEKRRLLNAGEYRVFCALESLVSEVSSDFRVMAQTSLGELIQPSGTISQRASKEAFASVNSKRLDFAVIDRSGYLALAVEYQGSGHHLSRKAFMRDAVKREALRRAGVDLMEVGANWDRAELSIRVRNALTGAQASSGTAGGAHRG